MSGHKHRPRRSSDRIREFGQETWTSTFRFAMESMYTSDVVNYVSSGVLAAIFITTVISVGRGQPLPSFESLVVAVLCGAGGGVGFLLFDRLVFADPSAVLLDCPGGCAVSGYDNHGYGPQNEYSVRSAVSSLYLGFAAIAIVSGTLIAVFGGGLRDGAPFGIWMSMVGVLSLWDYFRTPSTVMFDGGMIVFVAPGRVSKMPVSDLRRVRLSGGNQYLVHFEFARRKVSMLNNIEHFSECLQRLHCA